MSTVAVVVEHGADGRTDGQAAPLDKGQRHMAGIVGFWAIEYGEGAGLDA